MSGQVLGSLIVVKKIVNLVDSSAKSAHYIQYLECIASIFKCDVMHEKVPILIRKFHFWADDIAFDMYE